VIVHEVAVLESLSFGVLLGLRSPCARLVSWTLLGVDGKARGFTFHDQKAPVALRCQRRLTTFAGSGLTSGWWSCVIAPMSPSPSHGAPYMPTRQRP